MSIRVAALTQGLHQPSARFRVRQCIEPLRKGGVHVEEFPSRLGAYPPPRAIERLLWGPSELISRLSTVRSSRRYDLVWLQRELLSTIPTLERLTGRPRVFDVDDAIWLNSRFHHADRIAASCDAVFAGNSFIAEHFSRVNKRVSIVPTAIDVDRFAYREPQDRARPVIGWMGSSSGFPYLKSIERALSDVLEAFPTAIVRVVADREPDWAFLGSRGEFRPWSEADEVTHLHDFDIGIMPLPDDAWARGKCSFKMLTYMATGSAVVASPVGMNNDIFALAPVGLAPRTSAEWSEAILELLRSHDSRARHARVARQVVEERFALPSIAHTLAGNFRSLMGPT